MIRTGLAIILGVWMAASVAGQVTVRTVDGKSLKGDRLRLAGAELVLEGSAEAQKVALKRVIDFDFGQTTLLAASGDASRLRFELAHGDLVFGPVIDGDYDNVRVDCAMLGPLALPIDSIKRVLVPANLGKKISLDELIVPEGEERDFLYLKTDRTVDRVAGELETFRRKGLLFAWNEQGASTFGFEKDRVLALCLGSTEPPAPPEGLHVSVDFRDTSRLRGRLKAGEAGGLVLEIAGGTVVPLRPDKVLRVSVRGGDFSYLSDWPEKAHRETPFIEGGLSWGLHRDRGLAGGRVDVGGRYFSKALCVHTRSEIDFAVPAEMKRFDAWVGLDDAVAKRSVKGAVAFTVLGDGKVLAGPILKRAGEAPTRIERLDLKGAKLITLRADFADRRHFNAWAVWGDAMLIRAD